MAHIEDRWYKTVKIDGRSVEVPKPGRGKGLRYRVRYKGPDGRERSESFPDKRKREAQAFLSRVQADLARGVYVDPAAGRTTFQSYATAWLDGMTTSQNTRDRHERQLRLHVFPVFGSVPLAAVQPTTIRTWQRRLQDAGLAPGYRRLLFHDISAILNAAVDDRMIPVNPCAAKTVRAPKPTPSKVVPWSVDVLHAVRAEMRARYRVTLDLGAGCGLRQGEILGISPDDLDEDREMLRVVRQLRLVRGSMVFGLPKGGKTREVPLPRSVVTRVRAHFAEFDPATVTLPWETLDGEPHRVRLLVTTDRGQSVHSGTFNYHAWKPALKKAGVEPTRQNGMHVLRHTYASVLLDAGESVKALSLYLGHADPGFTLRVYTHLMPTSEDRTRRAIDRALGSANDCDWAEVNQT
jgi:integrase